MHNCGPGPLSVFFSLSIFLYGGFFSTKHSLFILHECHSSLGVQLLEYYTLHYLCILSFDSGHLHLNYLLSI